MALKMTTRNASLSHRTGAKLIQPPTLSQGEHTETVSASICNSRLHSMPACRPCSNPCQSYIAGGTRSGGRLLARSADKRFGAANERLIYPFDPKHQIS